MRAMRAGMLSGWAVLLVVAASTLHLAAAKGGVPGLLDAWTCGVVADGYQLIPGTQWGTTPEIIKQLWYDSSCDLKICAYYVAKYDVLPGKSLGSLPKPLQNAWNWMRPYEMGSCDDLWATGAAAIPGVAPAVEVVVPDAVVPAADPVYEPWGCGVIRQGYQIMPGSGWGSAPQDVQKKWGDSTCDVLICAYFASKYGVPVPGKSWAKIPNELQNTWSYDRPGVGNCDKIWSTTALA